MVSCIAHSDSTHSDYHYNITVVSLFPEKMRKVIRANLELKFLHRIEFTFLLIVLEYLSAALSWTRSESSMVDKSILSVTFS